MDRLPAWRLRLSKSCLSSPVPARWPALGGRGVHLYVCDVCDVCVVDICGGGWDGSVAPEGPVGECLRANPLSALPEGGSCGPGGCVGGGESVSGVRGIKDLGPHLLGLVKVLRGGEGDPHFVLG